MKHIPEMQRAAIRAAIENAKRLFHRYNDGLIAHHELYMFLATETGDLHRSFPLPHLELRTLITMRDANQYITFLLVCSGLTFDSFFEIVGDDVYHWMYGLKKE